MRKELENPHIRAPSRPPKSVASAYLQQRFIDEPGPGENTPVEERCIVGLWYDPTAGREGSWVAETRRLDENVDAEIVEYYTGPYPGRSKIRCIVILLLFRSSGWVS